MEIYEANRLGTQKESALPSGRRSGPGPVGAKITAPVKPYAKHCPRHHYGISVYEVRFSAPMRPSHTTLLDHPLQDQHRCEFSYGVNTY